MKNKLISCLFLLGLMCLAFNARAVHVENMPVVCVQPNGDTLRCFVSGDEYYHRLHDALGYTIVRHPSTGYYVYAVEAAGRMVPSSLVAGKADPAALHLTPNLRASDKEIRSRIKAWQVPAQYALPAASFSPKTSTNSATNHGVMNNIVIYIRFSDENYFASTASAIDSMFNDTSATAVSMRSYFRSASYNQIDISTSFYPSPAGNAIRSYRDTHPRSYYQPYDSTTNTNGYTSYTERQNREFTLLESAVQYVNDSFPVPSTLNIDCNGDNRVDNVCFVVSGTFTGWSDLLWPHQWSIYDRYVYLNGKRVYTFNLQLENSGSHYFSVSTFCHEMFHTLGAPDLYHYYHYTNVSPAGSWDLMHSNTTPPQHMSAFMKYRYGNWIDTIPEIVNPGRYTLRSLGSGAENFCYRIPSQDPSQFYLLEYRRRSDRYESALPDDGLLIWRINTRYNGNAGFDDSATFDEVYLFRPNGTDDTTGGYVWQAAFSSSTLSSFGNQSNPPAWTTGGVADSTILLNNLSAASDSTFSFTYATSRPAEPLPSNVHCNLTIKMNDLYGDTWNGAALRIESANGHLYGSAFLGMNTADSATEHIHVSRGDSLYLRWTPGLYPDECSFSILDGQGQPLYDCRDASTIGSLATVIPNGCPTDGPSFTITVASSNETMGHVSGGGLYDAGATATLTATAAEGYHFLHWLSHDTLTANPLPIIVSQDSTFTAVFAANPYTVTLLNDHPAAGTATGGGTYLYGDTVQLSAQAATGYAFSHWSFSGQDSITDNPYFFPMPAHNISAATHFYLSPVGVNGAKGDAVLVQGCRQAIQIENAAGQYADVYDLLGRAVALHVCCTASPHRIAVPHAGMYVVRIDGHSYKALVTYR